MKLLERILYQVKNYQFNKQYYYKKLRQYKKKEDHYNE